MSSFAPALPRVGLAALLSLGSATLFTALSGLGHADAQRPPVAPLVEVEPVEPAPPPPIAETLTPPTPDPAAPPPEPVQPQPAPLQGVLPIEDFGGY